LTKNNRQSTISVLSALTDYETASLAFEDLNLVGKYGAWGA